jgi:hypothetical protein
MEVPILIQDHYGLTPLLIVVRNHETEGAEQLSNTGRIDVDSQDFFGQIVL